MIALEQQLKQLVQETCQHPHGSIARQRALTSLIRLINRSQKLWKDSSTYYEDALQLTWLYFCRNLCEPITAKSAYDSDRSNVITWMNAYLKRRLSDKTKVLQRTYIRDRADVNAQVLILRRLPPESSWQILAQEFALPVSTLSSFYQRKCIPLLKEFYEQQRVA